MTINDKIRDEKLQYGFNRAANISALSSGKIGKYEYMTGKETLPPQQHKRIIATKFTYSALEKRFGKQRKTISGCGTKEAEALKFRSLANKTNKLKWAEDVFPQSQLN